jgi:hypothetical protein
MKEGGLAGAGPPFFRLRLRVPRPSESLLKITRLCTVRLRKFQEWIG